MSDETMPDVLHAIGLGVEQLRARIAELETKSADEYSRAEYHAARSAEWEREFKAEQRAAEELRREVLRSVESIERGTANLRHLDKITLDLWHYIVELSGHRDTAKTKAERVALGHVVERLKEIRGWSDADRESA